MLFDISLPVKKYIQIYFNPQGFLHLPLLYYNSISDILLC